MDKQFTASEVRDWERAYKGTGAAKVFGAFADLLEAQEKAVPVAYAEFADNGCVRMWSRGYEERSPGTRMVPLYTRPAPSDAERLAEALERTARHRAAADGIDPDQWRSVLYGWEDRALTAHPAQAQPPAASVMFAAPETEEDVMAYLQIAKLHIKRFRETLQAALASQENPHA